MDQVSKIYRALKEKIIPFEGAHDIFTPRALVEEILSEVRLDGQVLVLFNIEFLASLIYTYKVPVERITFYSDHPNKDNICRKLRVKYISKLDTDMKFDVVVGNPPYQGTNDLGSAQPKSHNLWSKFTEKAVELIKPDGFVGFITPDSWMSPSSKVLKLFKDNSLIWVNTDASKYFSVGSSFTAWVLQKNKSLETVNIDGLSVRLSELQYLPRDFSRSYPIHDKVINRPRTRLQVNCDTTCHSDRKYGKLSNKKDDTFIYETYHTNAQTKFSKVKSRHHDSHKVIWTLSGYFKPFYDNGSVGTSEVCQYVLVKDKDHADRLLSYLNSKLYRFVIITGKWSGFLNGKLIRSLPELPDRTWNDAEIYDHFGLTQEEIDYVETTVK